MKSTNSFRSLLKVLCFSGHLLDVFTPHDCGKAGVNSMCEHVQACATWQLWAPCAA